MFAHPENSFLHVYPSHDKDATLVGYRIFPSESYGALGY